MRFISIVIVTVVCLFCGIACQGVQRYERTASKTLTEAADQARAGLTDAEGNWDASGPQLATVTQLAEEGGVIRSNSGVASREILFRTTGATLALTSQSDWDIRDAEIVTPDGKHLVRFGVLGTKTSEPTRASNEALDRMKEIVKTITPEQRAALERQAALGDSIARAVIDIIGLVSGVP